MTAQGQTIEKQAKTPGNPTPEQREVILIEPRISWSDHLEGEFLQKPKEIVLASVENIPRLPIIKDKPRVRRQNAQGSPDRVLRVERRRVGSGQCVALLQAKGFDIHGVAKNWPNAAVKAGYETGDEPKVGSVAVTTESSAGTSTGHVVYVEDIRDGFIWVEEQNYVKLTVSHGKIPIGSPIIVTYIYPKEV